jgi:hypothetical protein
MGSAYVALQWVLVAFIAVIGVVIIYRIGFGKTDLSSLLSETDSNKASMSRFQLLLFSFVIVGIYVTLCLQQGDLLEISNGVLGLMGISGGSYLISKGIQTQVNKAPQQPTPNGPDKPSPQ